MKRFAEALCAVLPLVAITGCYYCHAVGQTNPEAYCQWSIDHQREVGSLAGQEISRHWLVPGDGCVLSVALVDDGSDFQRDDITFATLWVEVPLDAETNQVLSPRAVVLGGTSRGLLPVDEKLAIDMRILESSETSLRVALKFEYFGHRILFTEVFATTDPLEEFARRPSDVLSN